jgi:hypothetical protein
MFGFVEPTSLLSYLQMLSSVAYSILDKLNQEGYISLHYNHFNIILPSKPVFSNWSLSFNSFG